MADEPEGIKIGLNEMYQIIGEFYVKNFALQRDLAEIRTQKDKKIVPLERKDGA